MWFINDRFYESMNQALKRLANDFAMLVYLNFFKETDIFL